MTVSETLRSKASEHSTNRLATVVMDFVVAKQRDVKDLTFDKLDAATRHVVEQFAKDYNMEHAALTDDGNAGYYLCTLEESLEYGSYVVASIGYDVFQVILVITDGELVGYGIEGGES